MKQRMIDFLIKNASPSIVLRVKKEILNNIMMWVSKVIFIEVLTPIPVTFVL